MAVTERALSVSLRSPAPPEGELRDGHRALRGAKQAVHTNRARQLLPEWRTTAGPVCVGSGMVDGQFIRWHGINTKNRSPVLSIGLLIIVYFTTDPTHRWSSKLYILQKSLYSCRNQ